MASGFKHVSVCICTFRRPELLAKLLDRLEHQKVDGLISYSIIVADNDDRMSAQPVVAAHQTRSAIRTMYCCEARRNIALARNTALQHAVGEYVATIDDDEFPELDWLLTMVEACDRLRAAGVLGPVRPHFDAPPPQWVLRGQFCERPEYPTGRLMRWEECRTGNVLFRRSILEGVPEPFDPVFGNGGEDQDFFMRMSARGHEFRWCNEGVVHETVPPERSTRSYMLRRAMLRGKNSLKHPIGRARRITKSLIAVPVYALAVPFVALAGQHVLMKCLVRLGDHSGRLLALIGLNPIDER